MKNTDVSFIPDATNSIMIDKYSMVINFKTRKGAFAFFRDLYKKGYDSIAIDLTEDSYQVGMSFQTFKEYMDKYSPQRKLL